MSSRRILLTGLSTYWGGRLAQALERDPAVEAIIGVDRRPPKVELQRTEYVRVTDSHSLIRRVVEAAEIDTVVDTRLVVDSIVTSPRPDPSALRVSRARRIVPTRKPDASSRSICISRMRPRSTRAARFSPIPAS